MLFPLPLLTAMVWLSLSVPAAEDAAALGGFRYLSRLKYDPPVFPFGDRTFLRLPQVRWLRLLRGLSKCDRSGTGSQGNFAKGVWYTWSGNYASKELQTRLAEEPAHTSIYSIHRLGIHHHQQRCYRCCWCMTCLSYEHLSKWQFVDLPVSWLWIGADCWRLTRWKNLIAGSGWFRSASWQRGKSRLSLLDNRHPVARYRHHGFPQVYSPCWRSLGERGLKTFPTMTWYLANKANCATVSVSRV